MLKNPSKRLDKVYCSTKEDVTISKLFADSSFFKSLLHFDSSTQNKLIKRKRAEKERESVLGEGAGGPGGDNSERG